MIFVNNMYTLFIGGEYMALTKEDLQAIGDLMDSKLSTALVPVNVRLDAMQSDIEQIKADTAAMQPDLEQVKADTASMQSDLEQVKEDTAITRETVNTLVEWTEIASDVLRIKYPVKG